MNPWFLGRYAKRLEDEIQALDANGYEYSQNEVERIAGRLVLIVKFQIEEETHDLIVSFPDNYPYFPFGISSATFPDGRHKSPYEGVLCLIKDPQTNWKTDDTLASFLNSKVRDIVKVHAGHKDAENLEAHEAAQITGYFQYQAGTTVFTGDWAINQEVSCGHLSIGLERNTDPNSCLRGAVLEVQDENKNTLATLDKNLQSRYPNAIVGRWVRLPHAPKSGDPLQILNEAIAQWPDLSVPKFQHGPDVVGVLIPEEIQYNQYHENWIFIVRRKQVIKKQLHYQCTLARSDQASRSALQARVPRISVLGQKKILVVGLGSLGSVFAWQMARAGTNTIHLIDNDLVQLGNIPRWLLGGGAVGHSKAQVLAQYLQREYPFLQTKAWDHRVGNIKPSPHHLSDLEVLPQALDGIDLIVDTTAEWCVSHFLSDQARERGIPYVWATGTPGGWGGAIGRVAPNKTLGCWKCYQRYLTDGTIARPQQEDIPDVQPVGCFHPTFTGAGFDMDHVTLAAVRLAVGTLCAGQEGAYPDFSWDVGIVDLWGKDEVPIAPEWKTYKLDKHPECDCHE